MAAVDPNEYLNLYDPPKDLTGESYSADAKTEIKKQIRELFQKTAGRGIPHIASGDTKKKMKKLFETGEPGRSGILSAILEDKTRQLQILRGIAVTGHDPRPVGLNVAQDSGSKDVVKNPNFIITPGTILDPAGKTKEVKEGEGSVNWLTDGAYATLPHEYIKVLQMDNAISGPIVMESDATDFKFTIPLLFGGAAPGNQIQAKLKKATFLPGSPSALSGTDEDFFKGNPLKNAYIKDNYTETDRCKKFILVKELGDSLQVIWLKYIFALSAATAEKKYNQANTAIITGDTVLWYRALYNEVGVILSYQGLTTYYSANPEAADAAFILAIREETIAHNISVINIIQKVIDQEFITERETAESGKWINASTWSRVAYTKAKSYLTTLKTELIQQNNDFDIYFKKITTREAAKALAGRVHFINPFTYSKSNVSWIVNTKVTHLRIDGAITFKAASFKASVIGSASDPLGTDQKLFAGIGTTRGGCQKGGARKTKGEKEELVTTSIRNSAGDEIAVIPLLIAATDSEWLSEGGENNPDVLASALARGNQESEAPLLRDRNVYTGTADSFTTRSEYEKYWSQNVDTPSGSGVNPVASLKDRSPNFLYIFVREFCPEIFTLAYMVKSIGIAGFDNVTIDLATKYKLYYYMTHDDKMLVYRDDVVGGNENDFQSSGSLRDETYSATMNSIALAKVILKVYPYLQTKFTADFLAVIGKYKSLIPDTTGLVLTPVQLSALTLNSMEGGGNEKGNETKDLIALAAIQNYEIYYSLAIKAAYQDRNVTESEFQSAIQTRAKIVPPKTPNSIVSRRSKYTPMSNHAAEMALESPLKGSIPVVNFYEGGKRKNYRKTQKKKKHSKKHRKTRKQK